MDIVVPELGESITEVQIGDWKKAVGDGVEVDEPIVVIETDKVTVELPAPAAGVITEIRVPTGEEAKVGDVIGTLEPGAAPKQTPDEAADATSSAATRQVRIEGSRSIIG